MIQFKLFGQVVIFFFFFVHKKGEDIRTSDLRFISCGPSRLNYLLKTTNGDLT